MNQQPTMSPRKPSILYGKRIDDAPRRSAGRMILCLGNLPGMAVIERYFQERGWRIHLAGSGNEAREAAYALEATAAIVAEYAPNEESGWLTCWKLLSGKPKMNIVIVGDRDVDEGSRLADFVGASAYVPASQSAAGICRALAEATAF